MHRPWALPLVDQVLANASNALTVFVVAGISDAETFGRFSVAYAFVAFLVALVRSAFGYQVSLSAHDARALAEETNRASTAVLALSPVAIAVVAVGSVAIAGQTGGVIWIVALAAPVVLVQDVLRYAAVAGERVGLAIASDSAWLAFIVPGVVIRLTGSASSLAVLALWALGAVVAAGILWLPLRVRLVTRGLRTWIIETWRHRTDLALGSVAAGLSVPIGSSLVAGIAGAEITGGIAGAAQLMAPVNTLVAFLSLTLLSRGARMSDGERTHSFWRWGGFVTTATVAWWLVLLVIPSSFGTLLLGDTWALTESALPVLGLQYGAGVLAQTGVLLLVSRGTTGRARSSLLVQAVARLVAAYLAARLVGTVLGVAVGETVVMLIWLATVVALLRTPKVPHPVVVDDPMSRS